MTLTLSHDKASISMAIMNDLITRTAALPLFEGLPEGHIRSLAAIAHEKSFDRGDIIFSEGDEASGLFVLVEGRVKIFKLSLDGKEQILHLFGPGEPFGEVAVFTGRHFPAYAQAMEKSMVLVYPRGALLDLLRREPDLAMNMLAILSLRLRRFTNLIEDLSLKEVPTRLAAYLLYLSDHQSGAATLELDVTKGQLASLLGTIPETLSRILTKMIRQGLIDMDGPRIKILDRDLLQDLADSVTKL